MIAARGTHIARSVRFWCSTRLAVFTGGIPRDRAWLVMRAWRSWVGGGGGGGGRWRCAGVVRFGRFWRRIFGMVCCATVRRAMVGDGVVGGRGVRGVGT